MQGGSAILKPIEYRGQWWLPDKPENKIPGIIMHSPRERSILSLDGAFKARAGEFNNYGFLI